MEDKKLYTLWKYMIYDRNEGEVLVEGRMKTPKGGGAGAAAKRVVADHADIIGEHKDAYVDGTLSIRVSHEQW